MRQWIFAIFISFTLIGCTIKGEQYHANDHYTKCDNFSLMFLEFKDDGSLYDNKQKEYIFKKLKETKRKHNIFIFVHGFNHNAEKNDEDIKIFKNYLSYMSSKETNSIGIYVGWRGKQTSSDTYNSVCCFNERKTVSEKIGQSGFNNFLHELKNQTSDNNLVVIGHSLGATLVYNAINESLKDNSSLDYINLVVLLNPAFEALQYVEQLKYLEKKECCKYEDQKTLKYQKPKLIMTTSNSDSRTNISFKFTRSFDSKENITLLNRKCELEKHKVSDLNVSTVANYKPFQTHKISVYKNNQLDKNTTVSYDLTNAKFKNERWEVPLKELGIKIKHLGNSSISNPYWIIDVDEEIISGHRDINDTRLMSFIKHLVNKKEKK